ncbi:MAG: hypothetical protein RRY53_05830, partial [Pseudoflavonifractor sp.]
LVGRNLSSGVSGMMTVRVPGLEDTATDRTTIDIRVTNQTPGAFFQIKTDRLNQYAENFFYVDNQATITDSASDYEQSIDTIQYQIDKDGVMVASISNFGYVTGVPEIIGNVKSSAAAGTIQLTFLKSGVYVIRSTVTDECGAPAEYEKTIFVSSPPAEPTAIIKTNRYAFMDTPTAVRDASTDPNNDIVRWQWDAIQRVETNGKLTPATGCTKNGLQDGSGITKPSSVDGTLSFAKKGLYQLGLTVTDATDFTSNTTATIKVIENVPVPDPDPEPVNPDPDPSPKPDPSPSPSTSPDPSPKPSPDPDPSPSTSPSPSPSASPDPDPSPSPDPTTPPYEDGGFPHWEGDTLVVKQNRLFVINLSNSLNPPASPILWDKTEWIIKPIGDYDVATLKLDKKNSTPKSNHYLSKTAGEFNLTIILHNKYSDDLAINDPTNEDLPARETTIRIRILPDVKPLVALQVEGAHPNFHDNPSSVNVKVIAVANSADHDIIDYYDWSLVRDSNGNKDYADDAVLQSIKKGKQAQIS